MKYFLILFLFVNSVFSAQRKDVEIINLPPKTVQMVFPLVKMKNNPRVAEKINMYLQVTLLETIPHAAKNPFEKISKGTTSYQGFTNFYDWKVSSTPENILSVALSGDATGAYTENFTKYQNFDLRTGNRIDIQDVLTVEGEFFILEKCKTTIRKRIKKFLQQIEKEIANNDEEYLKEQKELYVDCLEWLKEYDMNWFSYSFEKNQILFIRERCSNHAMRALDDLGAYEIPITYQELKPYLTDFGKSLIFNSPKNVEISNPNFRIYKGKIGKYPVHFLVGEIYEDSSLSVIYWYDKYKNPIELRGKYIDGHFSLVEDDYHDETLKKWIPKAHIKMNLNGKNITGIWIDDQTKKQLKIILKEK